MVVAACGPCQSLQCPLAPGALPPEERATSSCVLPCPPHLALLCSLAKLRAVAAQLRQCPCRGVLGLCRPKRGPDMHMKRGPACKCANTLPAYYVLACLSAGCFCGMFDRDWGDWGSPGLCRRSTSCKPQWLHTWMRVVGALVMQSACGHGACMMYRLYIPSYAEGRCGVERGHTVTRMTDRTHDHAPGR